MAYGISNAHVTDDVTWPPKVLQGSTTAIQRQLGSLLCISQLLQSHVFRSHWVEDGYCCQKKSSCWNQRSYKYSIFIYYVFGWNWL